MYATGENSLLSGEARDITDTKPANGPGSSSVLRCVVILACLLLLPCCDLPAGWVGQPANTRHVPAQVNICNIIIGSGIIGEMQPR